MKSELKGTVCAEVMDELVAQQELQVFQLAGTEECVMIGNFAAGDKLAMVLRALLAHARACSCTVRCLAQDGVTCQTPDNIVLIKDLTFSVSQGESCIIMGPSGVGKVRCRLLLIRWLWPHS